ncbi:MAG: hypothetical protein GX359_07250 [Clostridiales bacterium]|nr:hypothetical protein [Clostridiales bacterium]
MFNPSKLFKIKNAWDTFSSNHPKFTMFLNAMHKNGLEEGTIIEINVTSASGKTLSSNLKLTRSDMDLFRELSELSKK